MRAFLCAAALAASAGGPARAEAAEVMVFAAASTANAIQDVIALYGARGADRVVASFAASSALARQIENGAPAEIDPASRIARSNATLPGPTATSGPNRIRNRSFRGSAIAPILSLVIGTQYLIHASHRPGPAPPLAWPARTTNR